MKTNIKILGIIYTGIAVLLGLVVLLFTVYMFFGPKAQPGGVGIIIAFVGLFFWFFQTGLGLWKLRAGARLSALIVGLVFMLVLNGLLLFADGGKYANTTGQKIFHISCMAIGLYTIVVLLLPRAGAEFQN